VCCFVAVLDVCETVVAPRKARPGHLTDSSVMGVLLPPRRSEGDIVKHWARGSCLCYAITTAIVVAGACFGRAFVKPRLEENQGLDVFAMFGRTDGVHYARIAAAGYSYTARQGSDVAFFPLYPLMGRLVTEVTGLRVEAALLLVSHLFLLAAFAVLFLYVQDRCSAHIGTESASDIAGRACLAFGLLPATFFFRMAYSESLFLFLGLAALYGMHRNWPTVVIALLAGLLTAVRPVGIAIVPVLVLYLWQRSASVAAWMKTCIVFIPLACWGIAEYMLYQWVFFGDPIAFAKTQAYWAARGPVASVEEVIALLTFEPIVSVYDDSSPCCWHNADSNMVFSLIFANPLYFLFALSLLAIGAATRWLSSHECLFGFLLLAIPYATKGYDNCMFSMARFVSACIPMYLVLGQLLWRMPPLAGVSTLAVSGCLLAAYSALFATGYWLF
jgi:hypothetical protein